MPTNVKSYTDEQIINQVEKLSTFNGWKKGKYQIAIRSNEDEFDKFDDKIYSYECIKEGIKPVFIDVHSCTTNPGAQGLKNFENYGNQRCAVLKADHMIYNSHRSEEHTSELQSQSNLVCRLLL